ncbi:B12-binding domain-containing radical SAM protein [Roseibium aggregatum]|uniref:Radical SAM protein n=1 Tax=Roseibium aggregatum TaxID=187304 RepID=A0A926S8Q8_9HYPH|nr:radical SAM protein [Roseibium aggregatum]MBD1549157.1 radical SAM protein [Roseibium aggregatum]
MPKFHIEIIKPSHYDNDGYVLQWWKAWIPSNSMACLYAIAQDSADRKVLGEDVDIVVNAYDEMTMRLPLDRIVRTIKANDNKGIVCLVGVQSNQYPRAMDIARKLRAQGITVAIGGFHVSGCISMLKDLPKDLQDALDLGVTLFAGEVEECFDDFLTEAYEGSLKPVYNKMNDLPALQHQVAPILPESIVRKYDGKTSSFDAGRGCPFQCSFCTIINVQGRKSRWRDADDIETLIRANHAQGIHSFFITDDNFARNKNWEPIFDRIIELREKERINIRFLIQVDTLAHRLPNFIEKAAKAGCTNVFIGLESINPENLAHMKKGQNRITEYRKMFQMWKEHGIMTYAGFIMGLPNDTPDSIRRDIELIKRELPVDVLEFTMLTPLPGSEDHKVLYEKGTWLDPDLNRYDLEHATIEHPKMSKEVWQQTYEDIWDWYYTDEHIETLMRRNMAYGIKPVRVWRMCLQIYGAMHFEGVHPQQCGYLRLKDPEQRRPGFKRIPSVLFYPVFAVDSLIKYVKFGAYAWKLNRMRMRIQKDKSNRNYTDLAIKPVVEGEEESLEMFELNDASRAAVAKAKKQKQILQGSRSKDEAPLDAAQ